MSDPNNLETMQKEHDTPRPSRMKKTEVVQELSSTSGKIASVSPDRGADDKVEVEHKLGELTPPRDEVDPLNTRNVSPPKHSS